MFIFVAGQLFFYMSACFFCWTCFWIWAIAFLSGHLFSYWACFQSSPAVLLSGYLFLPKYWECVSRYMFLKQKDVLLQMNTCLYCFKCSYLDFRRRWHPYVWLGLRISVFYGTCFVGSGWLATAALSAAEFQHLYFILEVCKHMLKPGFDVYVGRDLPA